MGTLRLAKALEARLRAGHPWCYADALRDASGTPGDVATLLDRRGAFLGRGIVDAGALHLRVWTTRDEALDEALLRRRLDRARELRADVVPDHTTAYRLLHGEGDRMPGVTLDVYGASKGTARHGVLRLDGAGARAWRNRLVPWLERTLAPGAEGEGLSSLRVRGGRGEAPTLAFGEASQGPLAVTEHGMTLLADLDAGQKTGLFLDHREGRRRVRALARGRRVLNLYAYTGAFGVAAGLGGATRVTNVDVAPAAIELAEATWEANGLDAARHRAVVGDVPGFLAGDEAREDLIIADPPSFAPRESAVPQALESYRKLHAACLKRLLPGGLYLAASCSSHVTAEAFLCTVRAGAQKARKTLQLLDRWGSPADHPRLAAFPEGDYLKALLLRVVD
ncbi:MAG: class I SAM-dependent rRNA methyltransferase [Myxococcota bacterium]